MKRLSFAVFLVVICNILYTSELSINSNSMFLLCFDVSFSPLKLGLKLDYRPFEFLSFQLNPGVNIVNSTVYSNRTSTIVSESDLFLKRILLSTLYCIPVNGVPTSPTIGFGPVYCYNELTGHGIGGRLSWQSSTKPGTITMSIDLNLIKNLNLIESVKYFLKAYYKSPAYSINDENEIKKHYDLELTAFMSIGYAF